MVLRLHENRYTRSYGFPPGKDRLISPYDLDARHSVTCDHGWDGSTVHVGTVNFLALPRFRW